jgi:hypothetical protein
MSTSKLDTSGIFETLLVKENATQLTLPAQAVKIRKNGIEFLTHRPLALWTEMSVDLVSGIDAQKVHCQGVVVSSSGNRHTGYVISMLFMNVSRQAEESLEQFEFSRV